MALFNKILIANRGEIASAIIRSAGNLGIKTVAVYTEPEKKAPYVESADQAVSLGDGEISQTFLNIDRIIGIALSTGAQAIHPGYGFQSENPAFAEACKKNNLIFIGPDADVLRLTGNKPKAKELAAQLGIPVISGYKIDRGKTLIKDLTYPLLIKPSYGGGGKGMQQVNSGEEFTSLIEKSSRTALSYFGNGELFAEQYIRNARHAEVQIIGDIHNNIIHLYERDCSIQRNHQKIIEEAPATWLKPALREKLLEAAVKIGRAVNYTGAGTVEFLVDETDNFYFMEINPRIQVEYAVTEMVTGFDIIRAQLMIASGFRLDVAQNDITVTGHAIEARIYAEDPVHNFLPAALPVLSVNLPGHPHIRIETDINTNNQLSQQFDPLLVKLIAWGHTRDRAIGLLSNAIGNLNIIGPETNTRYLEAILDQADFRQNRTTVQFCRNYHKLLIYQYNRPSLPVHLPFLLAASLELIYLKTEQSLADPWQHLGFWRLTRPVIPLTVDGVNQEVIIQHAGNQGNTFRHNSEDINFNVITREKNNIRIEIKGVIRHMSFLFESSQHICISCENCRYTISLPGLLRNYPESRIKSGEHPIQVTGEIKSPLHGKVLEINVVKNQIIKKGDLMMVIDAMKSENRILSPLDAKVKEIAVNVGAQVSDQMPLLFLEEMS